MHGVAVEAFGDVPGIWAARDKEALARRNESHAPVDDAENIVGIAKGARDETEKTGKRSENEDWQRSGSEGGGCGNLRKPTHFTASTSIKPGISNSGVSYLKYSGRITGFPRF